MANSMVCHLESDASRFGNPPESHAFRDLVLASSGSVESGWQVVPLTNGAGTITLHLAHNGDYIHAVDNQTTPTVAVNSTPVTIAAFSAPAVKVVAAASAPPASLADSFTISSMNLSGNSLTVAGSDGTGLTGTMREFLDVTYIGVVAPTLENGKFTASIKEVAAGPHQLELTIDGDGNAAFYDFTRTANLTTQASAIITAPNAASTGSAAALLAQLQQNHALVLPASL